MTQLNEYIFSESILLSSEILGGTAFILCAAWMVLFVIFIFSYFFGILNNHGGFLQFMVIIFLANLVADLILQSQYLPEQPWTVADKALDATMFCLFTIDEILNFILMVKISCCQTSCWTQRKFRSELHLLSLITYIRQSIWKVIKSCSLLIAKW